MTKILSYEESVKYFNEALNYVEFVETLNDYEINKLIVVCRDEINKNTILANKLYIMNKESSEFIQDQLEWIEESYLGKAKRLMRLLTEKVKTNKIAIIKKELDIDEKFNDYLQINEPAFEVQIIVKYQGLGVTALMGKLMAMEKLNLIKPTFFSLTHEIIHKMLIETFRMKGNRSMVTKVLNNYKGANGLIINEMIKDSVKELNELKKNNEM